MKKNRNKLILGFLQVIKYFVLLISLILLYSNYADKFDCLKSTGSALLTSMGVFLAITISFFISKLYSDRNEKNEIQREIDKLSIKLTALRKFSYHILKIDEFWMWNKINVKEKIEKDYSKLSWKEFNNFSSVQIGVLKKELGFELRFFETYIALRDLTKGKLEKIIYVEDSSLPYSLKELKYFKTLFDRIYNFFDESDEFPDYLKDINCCHYPFKNDMVRNCRELGIVIKKEDISNSFINGLYYDEYNEIIDDLEHYTKKSKNIPDFLFKSIFFDIGLLSIILMASTLLYSLREEVITNLQNRFSINFTGLFISIFIFGVLDILANIFISIIKVFKLKD